MKEKIYEKPDDIPQDVWDRANEFPDILPWMNDQDWIARRRIAAYAMMAERDAVISAINGLPGMDDADCCDGFEKAREDAIKSIRSRK